MPTIETLRVLAERLGVLPLDLLNFPEDGSSRERLIDLTRGASRKELDALVARLRRGS